MADSGVVVRVTRRVPDDVWTQALERMFKALIYKAAEYGKDFVPVDRGAGRRSLSPQSADVKVDGGKWPSWASYGPKVNATPYLGYLNAGSYIRTWVPPFAAIQRWGGHKGMSAVEVGTIYGAIKWGPKPQKVTYHYVGNPNATPRKAGHDKYGTQTKGWFNPGVPDALRGGRDLDEAANDFARDIEKRWNRR